MKQNLYKTLALAVLLAVGMNSHAKSWRVNNDTSRGAKFASINAAMGSEEVQDGDTLYLDPGCLISNQTVTKSVTIIGNGFFSNALPYSLATINGTLYLRAAHIKVYGLILDAVAMGGDYIVIERCKINYIYHQTNTSRYATIRNCFFNTISDPIRGNGTNSENSFSWTIENNIIVYNSYYDIIASLYAPLIRNNVIIKTYGYSINTIQSMTNATITNNVIMFTVNGYKNNLFNDLINCSVHHNVLSCEEGTFSNYPNNLCLGAIDLSTVFTQTGGNDEAYRLSENSPAKGYADFGGDCGAFDGAYPYICGGFPLGLPYYTNAVIGPIAHDGQVKVSLKAIIKDE